MSAAAGPPQSEGEWKHVHPLTPVLKGGAGIVAAFGVAFYIVLQNLQDIAQSLVVDAVGGESEDTGFFEGIGLLGPFFREHPGYVLAGLGVLLLVLAVIGLGLWLSWKAMRYRIDAAGVHLRTGVLSKKEKSASHDRVQSVDISLPFLPRLLGLASLVFDVAGGADSDVTISYLKRSRAEELREEILSHLRGLRAGPQGTSQPGASSRAGGSAEAGAGAGAAPGAAVGTEGEQPGTGPVAPGTAGPGHEDAQTPGDDARAAAAADAPLGQRLVSRRRLQDLQHGLQHEATGVAEDLSATLAELLAPYRLQPQAEAEGRLVRVPFHRLMASAALSTVMLMSVLGIVLLAVLVILLFVFVGPEAGGPTLGGLIPAVIAIASVFRSEASLANFSVAVTQDGLRVSHGLASTTNRIIPLDRIQAVKLTQPVLWRIPGWWRATFTLASEGRSDDQAQSVLLPVGGVDDVMLMLGLAMPDPRTAPGTDARELVLAGMQGPMAGEAPGGAESQFCGRPRASRWLDPFTWRRNAHALTGTFALIRSGRLTRTLEFVPHARVQSMRLHQGPLQRGLGLSSIQLHISPGPITPQLFHLEAADAARLFEEHAQRTRLAREELDTELEGRKR